VYFSLLCSLREERGKGRKGEGVRGGRMKYGRREEGVVPSQAPQLGFSSIGALNKEKSVQHAPQNN
jgi:hypothetical protein